MLPCVSMDRRSFRWIVLVIVALGCEHRRDSEEARAAWLRVLQSKKVAVAPGAPVEVRQAYADALAGFVRTYPGHSRAIEVYRVTQLDFATELTGHGRHEEAVRMYRDVLARHPHDAAALAGLNQSLARLVVSRAKLLELEQGMGQRDVAHLLGKPAPGWSTRRQRQGVAIESWYYKTDGGGVAAVHFREGRLFAADEQSNRPLAPASR